MTAVYKKLFLAPDNVLVTEPLTSSAEVAYKATTGQAAWTLTFTEATELTGYMKLRVWVEARAVGSKQPHPDDVGLFVAVSKLDTNGQHVPFYGSVGNPQDVVTRGWARASFRELNEAESTEYHPVIAAQ